MSGAVTTLTETTRLHELQAETEWLLAKATRSAGLLDATITAVAGGMMVLDADGRIVRCNEAARRIFGYSDQEMRLPIAERRGLSRFETPRGKPISLEEGEIVRALRGETTNGAETAITRRDGRRLWVSTSAAPIRTPDGRLHGAIATFTDTTALHELHEQRDEFITGLARPVSAAHGCLGPRAAAGTRSGGARARNRCHPSEAHREHRQAYGGHDFGLG